ncbi:MAG TPA: hypothetical protein PK715_11425, partial [Chitinophagales bacterium]|nr:hypothetical protein [Chitinophagales bacterium]
ANKFQIAFTAFYADCTHEIKPITSGYRLALVYNLLLDANNEKQVGSPNFSEQVTNMANILQTMEADGDAKFPKVILLGHQYTPANFSDQTLKLNDKPRYQAMLEAAKNAGYYTALGLVTHYLMGELELDYSSRKRRYGYYDDDEELKNGEMGEVYEEYMTIEHWGKSEFPELGEVDVEKEDIITDIAFDESEEPIEKEAEGYTGNAGMTMEYWYHYGAVVFWPKSKHANVLLDKGYQVWLKWLDYYTKRLNKEEPQAEEYCIKLLENLSDIAIETYKSYGINCNAIAQALLMLNQPQLFTQTMQEHLVQIFPFISSDNWANLAAQFNPDIAGTVFNKIADQNDIVLTKHIIEILLSLLAETSITPKPHHFIEQEVALLPQRLEHTKPFALKDDRYIYALTGRLRKEAIATTIKLLLDISFFVNNNPIWEDDLVVIFTQNMQRTYVNEVLIPQLIKYKGVKGGLYGKLYGHALQDIQTRAADKPMPPPNWSREVPKTKANAHIWEMLRSFLQSPTETTFDYIKAESYRREMENAIHNVTIDLKMETIRKGSPYTLRLIKTQAAYDRLVQEWKDDVNLLAKLEEVNK